MTPLTRVDLLYVPHQVNVWLCFGHPAREHILDASRRALYFAAQCRFGVVEWRRNRFGTTVQQLYVLRALRPGARMERIDRVLPGAECLLRVASERKVHQVLALIEAVEDQDIDPAEVSPNYWRLVHNRLAVCLEPHRYTRDAHAAYLARLALGR